MNSIANLRSFPCRLRRAILSWWLFSMSIAAQWSVATLYFLSPSCHTLAHAGSTPRRDEAPSPPGIKIPLVSRLLVNSGSLKMVKLRELTLKKVMSTRSKYRKRAWYCISVSRSTEEGPSPVRGCCSDELPRFDKATSQTWMQYVVWGSEVLTGLEQTWQWPEVVMPRVKVERIAW